MSVGRQLTNISNELAAGVEENPEDPGGKFLKTSVTTY
jgi:hypothetical protein